jgi:hypothetical protein
MITVWAYGDAIELTHARRRELALHEPTLTAVFDALCLGKERTFILPFVNGRQVKPDVQLFDGDTVLLHLPVSGG